MLKSKFPEEHLAQVLKINKICETMAGNPCYLLTITSDVKRNDVVLGKADGERPSEPNTAKLKASSGHNVNLSSISKSAPTRMEENNNSNTNKSKDENDKAE